MRVAELIETLEGMDRGAEVRLAFQPNYPLESGVDRVAEVHLTDSEALTSGAGSVVYLGEGGEQGYLSGTAAEELGWQ